tara:strand:+ start:621 stop:1019 length:399 start_codon:yes stop_codon:yes gene_type:complete
MFDANATDIIFGVVLAVQHKPDLFEELVINYESLDANEALTLDMKMAEMMLGPVLEDPILMAGFEQLLDNHEEFKSRSKLKDKLIKAIIAYISCKRLVLGVDQYQPIIKIMDSVNEFNQELDDANKFQEENA